VPRTNDLTGFHFGLSKGFAVVCATVFYCIDLQAAAYDNNRDAVDLYRQRLRLMNRVTGANIDPLRGH